MEGCRLEILFLVSCVCRNYFLEKVFSFILFFNYWYLFKGRFDIWISGYG